MTSRTSGERPPGPSGSAAGGTSHHFDRVALGPYRHRYDCTCGYATDEVDNGTATAGAQLVRHIADTIPKENDT